MIGLITARSHYPLHSLRLLWRHSSQIMRGQAHVVLNISPILKPTCMETSLSGIACLLVIRQGGNKSVPVTFPINFPTKCISVIALLQSSEDSNMSKNRIRVVNISNTGFSIQNPQDTYMYIAIGL